MSIRQVYECDNCDERCDNSCAREGWVTIEGSVSRSTGRTVTTGHETEFLRGERHDFCGFACLAKALQKTVAKDPAADAYLSHNISSSDVRDNHVIEKSST